MATDLQTTEAATCASASRQSHIAQPFGIGLLLATCFASGSVLSAPGHSGSPGPRDVHPPGTAFADTIAEELADAWSDDPVQGSQVAPVLSDRPLVRTYPRLGGDSVFTPALNVAPLVDRPVEQRSARFRYEAQRLATRLTSTLPEPGPWAMFISGLAMIGFVVLRRSP